METTNSNRFYTKSLFLITILFFYVNFSFAQRTITATQAINFGKFYNLGSGGTVSVDWQGVRTTTGSIVAVSSSVVRPALFEIKLCQDAKTVNITYNSTTTLTSSNGGELILDLGPTDKGISGSSFTTNSNCNIITPLHMGGTLYITTSAQTGTYTGSFEISFDEQ